jgi:hypothetical protein
MEKACQSLQLEELPLEQVLHLSLGQSQLFQRLILRAVLYLLLAQLQQPCSVEQLVHLQNQSYRERLLRLPRRALRPPRFL